jgi:threonine dehydrogenase-like Zn-dependent dehydrogenase
MNEPMRAAVITGPRDLRIEEMSPPQPGPGQIRVRLEGCGVCHSNLPVWEGRDWFKYPMPPGNPGHEGWGRVEKTGSGASLNTGERVAFLSSSAYATHDLVQADQAVVLPVALDDMPFPGEPIGCAMNIFRRADVRKGQTVAIVGVGFLGALLTSLCKLAGARVIAIARRPFALDLARKYGADECLPIDGETAAKVKDLTEGKFCERVIEAVGEQAALDLSSELTGERGRLIIAGYHQDGPRQVNLWLWNWRGIDVVNAHERDPRVYVEGMRLACDAVATGRIDLSPLLASRYPLERLGDAFDAVKQRPDGFVKAWIEL